MQGATGRNPRNGIGEVVVRRATIRKVVIRNEVFVTLNESEVDSVLMTATEGPGARGVRTIRGAMGSGGITMINQRFGSINVRGTNVTGSVKISGSVGNQFRNDSWGFVPTQLLGGLFVEHSSGSVQASRT